MHSISLIIVGVLLAITICPFTSHATTTESTELEEPKILPLTDAKATNDDPKVGYSELWQEDDREVLIRNERGAKDNNGQGTTTGKKNKKEKNQMNNNKNSQKHLNKSPDTNSDTQNIPNNTQQQHQTNVKKHQQKHEKHEKNSKKHGTTEKPKQKDESKENDFCSHFRGMNTFMIFYFMFSPLDLRNLFIAFSSVHQSSSKLLIHIFPLSLPLVLFFLSTLAQTHAVIQKALGLSVIQKLILVLEH